MPELDARRALKLSNAAKKIQRRIRTYIARKYFLALMCAAVRMQSACRGRVACNKFEGLKRQAASVKIQKNQRRHLARKTYNNLKASAIILQAGMRAMAAHSAFRHRKRSKAATTIQARWRGHRDYKYHKKLKHASVRTQCRWRGRIARKELRKLKMAARETGALKEAKDKLEKQVEDLTLRLQLEKRRRADLEEEKSQDMTKLQNMVESLQTKLDETNALLVKEREAAQKAIEEASAIVQETPVPVEDTAKVEALTEELEKTKGSLESEKQRADDAERKLAEERESSEQKNQKLEEFGKKVSQLHESLSRLEEKLTNVESENKVLRQQALVMAQNNKLLSRSSRSILQRTESTKRTMELHSPSMIAREQSELEDRPQKSLNEKQQEYQDLLIRCTAQHLGFTRGRPVASCIIYKCLRQWHSFEVERTSIFDRIIQTIGHAIETGDNNDVLAYWLSNASTLLFLLQRTLKAGAAAGTAPQHRRSTSATLFGRMTLDDSAGTLRQVDAKYPALLFKQQLTAYVEKIYGMIRDNLKKEISPQLGLCIQAPRVSRANLSKGSARASASGAAQEILIAHWQGIVKSLGKNIKSDLLRNCRALV